MIHTMQCGHICKICLMLFFIIIILASSVCNATYLSNSSVISCSTLCSQLVSNKKNAPMPFIPSQEWLKNPAQVSKQLLLIQLFYWLILSYYINSGLNPPCFHIIHAQVANAVQSAQNAGINVFGPPAFGDLNSLPLILTTSICLTFLVIAIYHYNHSLMPAAITTAAPLPILADIHVEKLYKFISYIILVVAHAYLQLSIPTGHLVYTTNIFSIVDQGMPGCRAKVASKKIKNKNTRFEHIVLKTITHIHFIQAFLAIHDLADQFSSSIHSGPSFKLWQIGLV